jgi:hypothetical protein
MLKTFLYICISLFCFSFTLKAQTRFSDFKSLEGIWKIDNPNENSFEEWVFISDSLMLGKSFSIVKNDTITNEFLSIKAYNKAYFYSAKVLNQNNAEEITFKLISSKNKTYTFENPQHDFPKKITYCLVENNMITATIEDETRKFKIIMNKINK